MHKRITFLITALALSGALWWYFGSSRNNTDESIILYGNVEIRQVQMAFRVGGRIASMSLEEGACVAAGQSLAQLDPVPFQWELAEAKAKVSEAQALLMRLENGNRPQEIEQAKAQVLELEAATRILDKEAARKKPLVAQKLIDQQSYDEVTARLDEIRARLSGARQYLNLLQEGARQEDISQAKAALAAAIARQHTAQTRVEDCQLLAPSTGLILIKALEPGAMVSSGQTVYTLSLVDPVWVRAYVPEPMLGKIYPGLKAYIYTDSRPEPYAGQVGFISPEAEFTPKPVHTETLRADLVYRIRIVVDNPDNGLRQGMPVTIKLETMNIKQTK